MNKELNLLTGIVIVCVAAVLISAIVFGGKEVIRETTIERIVEQAAVEEVGGLVVPYQRMFPAGLLIGEKDIGSVGAWQLVTDSNDTFYIGSTTDSATFKIAKTGLVTITDINIATGSLVWTGDFSTGRFYSVVGTGNVGIGTSTPDYLLELSGGDADTVFAISQTSTNDTIIRMNTGGGAQQWAIFMDNSDDDILKITSTSDAGNILTIDKFGHLALNGSSTIAGIVTQGTTTINGTLTTGGNVIQLTSAITVLTAAQQCDSAIINYRLLDDNDSAETIFVASSTDLIADCISNPGDTSEFVLYNNATATLAVTIAVAGTDQALELGKVELLEPTGGNVVLNKGESAIIRMQNYNNVTTTALVIDTIEAD